MASDNEAQSSTMHRPIVMPESFSGGKEEDWGSWIKYFENCADINGWSNDIKSKFLQVRLRGSALKILQGLSGSDITNYLNLKSALTKKFLPLEKLSLYKAEFKAKTQQKETLTELASQIRTLANRAYPTASADLLDELSRDQFLEALTDKALRIKVKESDPSNLDQALTRALQLEALHEAENRRVGGRSATVGAVEAQDASLYQTKLLEEILENLKNPGNRLSSMQSRPASKLKDVVCFYCKKKGHVKANCFKLKHKQNSATSDCASNQQGN